MCACCCGCPEEKKRATCPNGFFACLGSDKSLTARLSAPSVDGSVSTSRASESRSRSLYYSIALAAMSLAIDRAYRAHGLAGLLKSESIRVLFLIDDDALRRALTLCPCLAPRPSSPRSFAMRRNWLWIRLATTSCNISWISSSPL